MKRKKQAAAVNGKEIFVREFNERLAIMEGLIKHGVSAYHAASEFRAYMRGVNSALFWGRVYRLDVFDQHDKKIDEAVEFAKLNPSDF